MDKYNNIIDNTKFFKQFNEIFNKIPHIYSEIFLKIFGEKYSYFVMFDNDNFSFSFIKILKNIFCNIDKIDDQNFFNKCVLSDLDGEFNDKIEDNIKKSIVSILSSDIEIKVLLDMIDNDNNNYYNLEIDNYDDELKIFILGIMDSYLISKILVRIVKILNFYNDKINTEFYNKINKGVSMFRTWDMVMDNVLDIYEDSDRDIISEEEFKILIYLLCLAKNGQDIEKNIDYNIEKLFVSIGYGTSVRNLIDYKRGSDYLEISSNNNCVWNLFQYRGYPVIYTSISEILEILFSKYYDDYNFIINKDRILRKIFYLYMKKINLNDKIFLCSNYKLWYYEWDSIKNNYELETVNNQEYFDKTIVN